MVLVKESELSLPQCQTRKNNHQEVLDFGYMGGSRGGGGVRKEGPDPPGKSQVAIGFLRIIIIGVVAPFQLNFEQNGRFTVIRQAAVPKYLQRLSAFITGADPGFFIKCVGVCFADFISFFLNIP